MEIVKSVDLHGRGIRDDDSFPLQMTVATCNNRHVLYVTEMDIFTFILEKTQRDGSNFVHFKTIFNVHCFPEASFFATREFLD